MDIFVREIVIIVEQHDTRRQNVAVSKIDDFAFRGGGLSFI